MKQTVFKLGRPIFTLFFLFTTLVFSQTEVQEELVYVKIEIKGLACPYCAFGMEKELKKVAGVNKVEIELKEGLAYISTPINQKPSKQSIEMIIKDAGFSVGNIVFSRSPFATKDND